MYRVVIRHPEPGRSTIYDEQPGNDEGFFRFVETIQEVEDLREFFGNRFIAVVLIEGNVNGHPRNNPL